VGARGRFARFGKVRRKPDANQAAIVKALRACGASVLELDSVGGGCPDLLVGYQDRNNYDRVNLLMEVKVDDGKLREGQVEFSRDWKGSAVVVVRTPAEALQAIGIRLDN
jgi:hypothetical protein